MVDSGYNPVIGYMLLDSNRHVIGPEGANIDPAFHTKQGALKAAEEYVREAEVHEVGEIYLEGIFNVIVWDQGDILLDGQSASRFVKACKRRGLKPSPNAMKRVNLFVKGAKYSARELLGDIDLNRGILLTQP